MCGLREVHIVLSDVSRDAIWENHWRVLEGKLLESVRAVIRPDCFEVVMPYKSCSINWDMRPSMVVLRRPETEEKDEDEEN